MLGLEDGRVEDLILGEREGLEDVFVVVREVEEGLVEVVFVVGEVEEGLDEVVFAVGEEERKEVGTAEEAEAEAHPL